MAAVRAVYDVYRAGAPVDFPGSPPMSFGVFGGLMVQGWCGEPRENWLACREPGGAVAGAYTLELPDRENRDRAGLSVLVAPGQRRAGLGTALLRHATARARALGRVRVSTEVLDGTPGDGFARAVGATAELTEARRTLDVRAIPSGRLGELRAMAKGPAAGYTLVAWAGPAPETYLDAVARLNEAMHDAPHGAGEEAQSWDAERVRAVGRRAIQQGLRHYSVAAQAETAQAETAQAETAQAETAGELAGLTELSVDPAHPHWGHQELSVVARPHRGHRLGLLLKVAMLELLAEREPQLETIETFNGVANAHMVSINETLGFQVTGRLTSWQLPTAPAE